MERVLEHTERDLQARCTCYSSCSSSSSSRRLCVCAGGQQHMPRSPVSPSQKKLQIILNSLPACLPHHIPAAASAAATTTADFFFFFFFFFRWQLIRRLRLPAAPSQRTGRNLLLGKSNTSVRLTLRPHQSEEPVIFLHPGRPVHIHLPQRQVKCGSVNKLAALR